MTTDTKLHQTAQPTVTIKMLEKEQGFNWRQCWYPVTFLQDLPQNRPYRFSVYDEPFVLFKNNDGLFGCLTDRCPHRAARLSDGQIIDGKIECLYHGWQFDNNGQCLHIPQLSAAAKIPASTCVKSFVAMERQGIVWVWLGEPEIADVKSIPVISALDNPETISTDYMRDLPYEQTYYIENVIDPAHVHITHHGIIGDREFARPLEIEVIENSASKIIGWCKGMGISKESWGKMEFIAPNVVVYTFNAKHQDRYVGTVLYSLPLGKERCRILLRNYSNLWSRKVKLTPRWWQHITVRNKILEGDLQLILGQKAQIERLGQSLQDVYLPLTTSDTFVIEYRKWLDKFGGSLPFYQGYSTSKHPSNNSGCNQKAIPLDRFSQHTSLCSSCCKAYQVTKRLKQTLLGVAIGIAALAIVTDGFWTQTGAVFSSLLAVAFAVAVEQVKKQFE